MASIYEIYKKIREREKSAREEKEKERQELLEVYEKKKNHLLDLRREYERSMDRNMFRNISLRENTGIIPSPNSTTPSTGGINKNRGVNTITGWAEYGDLSTETTRITAIGGQWTQLTNDSQDSSNSNTDFLPNGVTKLWDTDTNSIYLKEISVNNSVRVRIDITVNPTVNNTLMQLRLRLDNIDLVEVVTPFNIGSGIDYRRIEQVDFFVGDESNLNKEITIEVQPTSDVQVEVNSFYIRVI